MFSWRRAPSLLLRLPALLFRALLALLPLLFEAMSGCGNTRKRRAPVSAAPAPSANWRLLLASSLMSTEPAPPAAPTPAGPPRYTGTFRRSRTKRPKGDPLPELRELNIRPGKGDENVLADPPSNLPEQKNKLTKFIAMDCEMVGVGRDGDDHMIARVSLVNKFGDCVYDKFVRAREDVTDYRTSISGVRKEDMLNGEEFTVVQNEVAEIVRGKILVGHSLKNDLAVLFLSHPKRNIRDTSRYKPFRKITQGSTPSLKRLAKELLGVEIQSGEHSSVEDARAAMKLYCSVGKKWEEMLGPQRGHIRQH